MKKRFLSFLLVLCMLVALVPVSAQADETADGAADGAVQISSYEELYVKENLLALFTVQGKNNNTVDLDNGKWYARVWDEGTSAFVTSDTVYAEIKGNDFTQAADGALGIFGATSFGDIADSGISFPDSFFVENESGVVNVTVQADIMFLAPVDADGNVLTDYSAFGTMNGDISSFRLKALQGTTVFGEDSAVVNKWMLSNATAATHNFTKAAAHFKVTGTAADGLSAAQGERLSFFMTATVAAASAKYSLGVIAETLASGSLNKKNLTALNKVSKTETSADLSILNGTPGAVYTVRVYSDALSEAALKINHAADVLFAKGGELMDEFNGLTQAERNMMIETLSFYDVADVTEEMLAQIIADKGVLLTEEQKKTDYDKLYVGADGSETANGGKMVALFSAFEKNSISVDLEDKIWYNKVPNSPNATIEGTDWAMGAISGFGYTMTAGDATPHEAIVNEKTVTYYTYANGNLNTNHRVVLPVELLGSQDKDFTVEMTVRYDEIRANLADGSTITYMAYKADGSLNYDSASETFSHQIGVLKDLYIRNMTFYFYGVTSPARYYRWYVNEGSAGWSSCGMKDTGLWGAPGRGDLNANTTVITRDVTGVASNMSAIYTVGVNGQQTNKSHAFTATGDIGASTLYPTSTSGTEFFLFRGMPVNAYAVRVYDAVLTENEQLQNRAVDVLAYAGADIEQYLAAKALYGSNLDRALANVAIGGDIAEVEAAIAAAYVAAEELGEAMKANDYDKLYVGMDGNPTANGGTIVGLFNAYGKAESYDAASGIWYNKANNELNATVRGSGWVVPESGGLAIDFAKADWNQGFHGISLPESFADLDNFYVDAIVSYRGLSDAGDNTYVGNASSFRFDLMAATYFTGGTFRYYISNRAWGQHNGRTSENTVYVFPGVWDNGSGKGAYVGNGSSANKGLVITQSFKKITTETEVQYGAYIDGSAKDLGGAWYGLQGDEERPAINGVTEGALPIATYQATQAASASNASGRFSLMNNTPGTVYSVRVYTAPLTKAEQARNAIADRLAYYSIDLSKYITLTGEAKDIIDAQVASLTLSGDLAKTKASIENQIETVEDLLATKAEGSTQNDYDKLYVGADGSETANGGKLTALFTAFEKDAVSASIVYAKWFNKVQGGFDIDMMGGAYAEDNVTGWRMGENGGFGYIDTDFAASHMYLRLDKSLVAGSYDVDIVAQMHLRSFDYEKETILGEQMTATPQGDGTIAYSYDNFKTTWNYQSPIVYVVSGDPGTTFTPTYYYIYNGTKTATIDPVTIGEDGTATIHATYRDKKPVLVLPETITLVSATADVSSARAEAGVTTSFVFGQFHAYTWTNLNGSNTWGNGFGTTRWYVNPSPWGSSALSWKDATSFKAYNEQVATLSATKHTDETGTTFFNAYHGGASVFGTSLDAAAVPAAYDFRMFHNLPADVFAVRVYDNVLTTAERNHNHLIDFIAMAGIAPTVITDLEATVVANLAGMMSGVPLTTDKAEAEALLGEFIDILNREPVDPEETFYVSDGLVGLYTMYESLTSSYTVSNNGVTWVNLLDPTESASLYGAGWEVLDNGGFRIQRTWDEWNKDSNFGIRLDYSQLPEDSYTVELAFNPVGIHTYDDNGNMIRYRDSVSVYGTYKDYGYILGPLRAMTYACFRGAGDGMLEKRWVYVSNGCWAAWGSAYGYTAAFQDQTWQYLDVDQVTTYSISLEEEGDVNGTYAFYGDAKHIGGITIPNVRVENYIDYENCGEKRFELFNHVAGTVYALRIYNRALTSDEVAQNRVADIIYYYDLDTSMFEAAIGNMEDTSTVYRALNILSFQMEPEEAQRIFDAKISAIWLTYSGVAARNDMSDGIRFYFDLNMEGVNNMLAANYQIEIGALVNVGRDYAPELGDNKYDYRIEAFNEVAGCVQGFFVDENTFCVTINYEDADRLSYITEVYVRGYVYLVTPAGDEMLFYAEPELEGQDEVKSLFAAYENVMEYSDVKDTDDALYEYLESVVDDSFVDHVIWVDSIAVPGGDGKESAPFATFEDALAAAKEFMATVDVPTNVIVRLKDGKYPVYEIQELAGSDMPYKHCYLTIEAENAGEATLTTTIDLDSGDFVECEDNIYKYQFAADAEGNFPGFRYLYANGEIAQAAAQGDVYAKYNNQTFTRYERTVDGIYEMVKAAYETGTLAELEADCPYDESRTSLLDAYNKYLEAFKAWDAYQKDNTLTKPADPTTTAYKDTIGAAIMAEGKIYLPESLIGGFEDYVAERRAAIADEDFDESTFYRTVLKDVGLLMHIVAQWDYNIMHIVGVDYDDYIYHAGDDETHYAVYMKMEEYKHYVIPTNYKFADRPVYLTDSYEFLDKEGEFYYDYVNGAVYYYTEGDIADVAFEYPTMDNLLVLDAPHNVTLWGLRFTGVDDYFLTANGHAGGQSAGDSRFGGFPTRAAIYVKNGATNLSIDSCYVNEVGAEGITMRGRIEDTTIMYNEITGTGASGLRVADNTNAFNDLHGLDNVTIMENYLADIAYVYRNASALHLGSNRNLILANNTIHDTSYSAVSIGWHWSLREGWMGETVGTGEHVNIYNADIYGNYIYDFMTEMADGGAIYMLGANADTHYTEYFNNIHDNYIVHTKDAGNGLGGMMCGIYFDGSCSNWYCYNNVVVEQSKGSGADVEGTPAYLRRRSTYFIYIQHIDSQLTHNMLCENNIVLNVRAKSSDKPYNNSTTAQRYEVYRTYVVAERNIVERGTRYINGVTNLAPAIQAIITSAGCWSEMGDPELLADDNY